MVNSVDSDQLASSSGSTLFARTGHLRVQQDQVEITTATEDIFILFYFFFFSEKIRFDNSHEMSSLTFSDKLNNNEFRIQHTIFAWHFNG